MNNNLNQASAPVYVTQTIPLSGDHLLGKCLSFRYPLYSAHQPFTPNSLPLNGGAAQVQMAVQTVKTTSSNTRVPFAPGTVPVMVAGLLLPLMGLRRRMRNTLQSRLMLLLLLIGGALGASAMTGCGSDQGFLSHDSVHNYTLTVITTGGSIQHSETVTLNVQ